jgi:hypothetical protein
MPIRIMYTYGYLIFLFISEIDSEIKIVSGSNLVKDISLHF